MRFWIDLETRSTVPIRRGTYLYAASAEIILWSWAVDDGPVHVEETPSDEMLLMAMCADELWAHNAQFDRVILQRIPGWIVPIDRWRCTAALARMHGLPGGLDRLCTALMVSHEKAKDARGKDLIQTFCVPQRGKNGFNDKTTHPKDWETFKEYAAQDVVAMREVWRKLPKWNATPYRWKLWYLNQRMNDAGVQLDTKLANCIVKAVKDASTKTNAQTKDIAELIGGNTELESTTQVQATLDALAEEGVKLHDLRADTVKMALENEDLPPNARWLLVARQEISKSSTAKAKRALESVCADGRLRGLITFYGAARTGRSSGQIFQPLNLPRPKHPQAEINQFIEALLHGAEDIYDPEHTIGYCSDALRGLLIAPNMLSSDWSSIEGRLVSWFAEDEIELARYVAADAGTGPSVYATTYADMFHVAPESVKKGSFEYQLGKVMTLALGYQGAIGALSNMSRTYGLRIPELCALAQPRIPRLLWEASIGDFEERVLSCLVKMWRDRRPKVRDLWYALEAAVGVVASNGRPKRVGRISVDKVDRWVRINWGSDKYLSYPAMRRDSPLSFYGVNPYTRAWGRISTYGGKLLENVCQAVAADLHDAALLKAAEANLNPVLTVYDELVCDAPLGRTSLELAAIMTNGPAWAKGLPLAAESWSGTRYRK